MSINAPITAAEEVYTGTSLTNLTPIVCGGSFGQLSTIRVTAGTTYYFQVGTFFGSRGPLTFNLVLTPPPTAFFFLPSDPPAFATIQFFDESFDPGEAGLQPEAWSLGEGTTGSGSAPTPTTGKLTIPFAFSYTFTQADAAIGKVTSRHP
jgi:hypothetical protein